MTFKAIVVLLMTFFLTSIALAQGCVECHRKVTPNIVSDWQLSKHSQNKVDCSTCHGDEHQSAGDFAKAEIPVPDTCATCHETQVEQFKGGKHALAWSVMEGMPTTHWLPMAMTTGKKGCGGCHKIGLKTEEELKDLKRDGAGFGVASCDACHTRHLFSVKEARQPQSCRTCHMGVDHPQWEMYSSSKHGVRFLLKQSGILPETVAAPTCQTCHMQDGDHAVRTSWGFFALRLPMPKDKQWASDRTAILQALGVIDPNGNPSTTRRLMMSWFQCFLTTEKGWQKERDKMVKTCSQCHSLNFARKELEKGDQMIKEADRLMAEAIRIVAALYKDGVLSKPRSYAYAFPDLLTFHDAPTVIEQKLFRMFHEHRMRAFKGTFHANPNYALWYGWSEMQRDLTEIKAMAEELRRNLK